MKPSSNQAPWHSVSSSVHSSLPTSISISTSTSASTPSNTLYDRGGPIVGDLSVPRPIRLSSSPTGYEEFPTSNKPLPPAIAISPPSSRTPSIRLSTLFRQGSLNLRNPAHSEDRERDRDSGFLLKRSLSSRSGSGRDSFTSVSSPIRSERKGQAPSGKSNLNVVVEDSKAFSTSSSPSSSSTASTKNDKASAGVGAGAARDFLGTGVDEDDPFKRISYISTAPTTVSTSKSSDPYSSSLLSLSDFRRSRRTSVTTYSTYPSSIDRKHGSFLVLEREEEDDDEKGEEEEQGEVKERAEGSGVASKDELDRESADEIVGFSYAATPPITSNNQDQGDKDPKKEEVKAPHAVEMGPFGNQLPPGMMQHVRHPGKPKAQRDEEENCPVCLESLSMRLRGEKPHIVPVCGHRLHEACFEAVYGGVARAQAQSKTGGGSLGLCGVCRRDMKLRSGLDDFGGSGGASNKFASISGIPGRSDPLDSHKMRSISNRTLTTDHSSSLHDPDEDDEIVSVISPLGSMHLDNTSARRGSQDTIGITNNGSTSGHQTPVPHFVTSFRSHSSALTEGPTTTHPQQQHPARPPVQPVITVRAEYPSITRSLEKDKNQHLTCMVTVELPSRNQQHIVSNSSASSSVMGGIPLPPSSARSSASGRDTASAHHSGHFVGGSSSNARRPPSADASRDGERTNDSHSVVSSNIPIRKDSIVSSASASSEGHKRKTSAAGESEISAYCFSPTAPPGAAGVDGRSDPFAGVVDDLQTRMADWKGHCPDDFGKLRLYDFLHVKKDKNMREFKVYLFDEALLCVTDDKKKNIASKVVESLSATSDRLRLKGRVYVRHIKDSIDTSDELGNLYLTIAMRDENLDRFVLSFKSKNTLNIWKSQIDVLIQQHAGRDQSAAAMSTPPESASPSESLPGRFVKSPSMPSSVRDSILSGETHATHSSAFSSPSTMYSMSSRHTRSTNASSVISSPVEPDSPEEEYKRHMASISDMSASTSLSIPPQMPQFHVSNITADPRDFTPLDLMLILSVPSPFTAPSSFSLKIKIIRQTLEFVINTVGPTARISIVAFTAGEGARGVLRKTPFLAVGKPEGRRKLELAVEEIGREPMESGADSEALALVDSRDPRVTVVTGVNLALDILLQRKSKNSLTGVILLNDGKDGTQKQQMDLVMARAEAANTPIHAFGWGKAHDPSSLWLLSNHTGGTYTFVREWYHLRDCIAGCVGGMVGRLFPWLPLAHPVLKPYDSQQLSIAITNLKLHLNVPEKRWFRIRKVAGTPNAVVSSDGKDVDIDMGFLSYGEKKEMLVEVEMEALVSGSGKAPQHPFQGRDGDKSRDSPQFSTATDEFFIRKIGHNPLAMNDFVATDFFDDEYDCMIDEAPLFEVQASYRDPALGVNVARLPRPLLLTITVNPPTQSHIPRSPSLTSDTAIVRRRMELLTSDMITRTLLLMSRRNDEQAQRLLSETKRIIAAITANQTSTLRQHQPQQQLQARVAQINVTNAVLMACMEDIDIILEGCQRRDEFDYVTRNFAAQQAVVLRDQRAWTNRTGTERKFFNADLAVWALSQSNQLG